ncbi:pyrroline-5-carboxylate reductase [Candidatus Venteria ishoeyi]|uniref:Pyrroline-5-carboxylate reductase n=1 Tax=Candidatus Venteria ishoeyi TaxID=1899563 RepID=A0A1H6F6Q0_9GAMM|nr:pyrroline-5-carboxylate reductase [Candidatus Venteria ishoeyi]MDM8548160.1 pyrroline-5-carboxylate reductase [Candidatus Venteria ishoeyi]SEH05203.1 Pyrroline-5-carboxylate reductase [Candidatus Venteria ishoeyi]
MMPVPALMTMDLKKMNTKTITFIGGGNMSRSLIGGLLENGMSAEHIRVADINPQPLANHYPVRIFTDNVQALAGSDVVVLAVKPQMMKSVCQEIASHIPHPVPTLISIAAGVRITDLQHWLGDDLPIVRVMPNTPALVQSGASALFAAEAVSQVQHELAESIMRAVGMTVWLDNEEQMNTVTALSGSGPAYFFLVMEMLENAAVKQGLPVDTARLLTLQTAFGAAKMALESQEDAASLRARVTSKGGTTEQAINALQNGGLQSLLDEAVSAAKQRSIDLAEELGEQA